MDERFVEAAMKNYGDSVLRAAAAVTGNRADAEDVFSDVFFTLFRRNEYFASETHLKAWLLRCAVNNAKNVRNSAHRRLSAELTDNVAAPKSVDSAYDVPAAMQALKPEDRIILYLHYYEGYTWVEIAAELAMPEGTVRSKALRARERMKAYFQNIEN